MFAAAAQAVTTASLPDAPGFAQNAQGNSTSPDTSGTKSSSNPQDVAQPELKPHQKITVIGPPTGRKQSKRILGIIPNFRTVSADTKLPPQNVKEKFFTAAQDTFDYSALTFSGLGATES